MSDLREGPHGELVIDALTRRGLKELLVELDRDLTSRIAIGNDRPCVYCSAQYQFTMPSPHNEGCDGVRMLSELRAAFAMVRGGPP